MGVPATAVDDYLRDLRDRPDTFRARASAPRKNGSPGVVELTLGTLGAVDDKLVADAIAPPTLAVVVGQPEASALFAPQNRCARPLGAPPDSEATQVGGLFGFCSECDEMRFGEQHQRAIFVLSQWGSARQPDGRLPEPLAPRSLLVYDAGVEPRQRRMAYRGTTHPEHILAL
jgi:hypothetical protein